MMFRRTFLSRTIRALVTDNHSEKFFIVNERRRATNSIAKTNLLSTQEGLIRSRKPACCFKTQVQVRRFRAAELFSVARVSKNEIVGRAKTKAR